MRRLLAFIGLCLIVLLMFNSMTSRHPEKEPVANYYGSVAEENVDVYARPAADSKIKLTIPQPNTPIFVFSCVGGWCFVRCVDGTVGYVKQSQHSKRETALIGRDTFIFRTKHLIGKQAFAKKDAIVFVLRKFPTAWKIHHEDGVIGFVSVHALRGI